MKRTFLVLTGALLAAGALAAGPAIAEKPEWAGKGKGKDRGDEMERGAKGKGKNKAAKAKHFESNHRAAIHDYYAQEFKSGFCPPGLAKKKNGCMPPGQAKKWKMGQPLAKDVVIYPLPRELVIKIGVPPVGHEYVRVASDILLIATGTRMVVDAITDLGRL
jgi:hypothetical protein